MEKTTEKNTNVTSEQAAAPAAAPVTVDFPYTFEKEVMITGYEAREIADRNNPDAPPSIWHAVSLSDGKGFMLKDISADKNCDPAKIQVFQKYKVYFEIAQRPNKNGNLAITLKIVGYKKI